ncbi:MAG: UDP-N-acetylmuramoyl-tripeptide--D-alanyl-D-alanine ligase, partial [Planctomycetes bacterium]|nr:UDP-N-acetylmuramoyl-tripeptide--D-alanyl-D-alanine ligase [Planctomycetota bacterium]
SEPGEIARLTQIVQPTIGVMTNIAEEHLEGLVDIDGVLEEEAALFRGMSECGIAIVNYDDPYSIKAQHHFAGKIVSFGFDRRATIRASDLVVNAAGSTFRVNERYTFTLNMLGRHNVSNALAAIALGWVLGVDIRVMQEALAAFRPVKMRSDFERIGKVNVINDCYNANPGSMRAAIQTLSDFRAKKRRIAFLGDMLELGDAAQRQHWLMGWWIAHRQVDHVVTVGPMMEILAARLQELEIPVDVCASSQEAAELAKKLVRAEDTVLVKGSRGMRMEIVTEMIRDKFAKKSLLRR